MKVSWAKFACFLAAAAVPARAAVPPPRTIDLDLEKCVRIALTGATQVLKSRNDYDLSGVELLKSYAQFLPTVDASSGATYGWGNQYYTFTTPVVVNSKSLSAQYELSTSLNLFNGLADMSAFNAALARRDAARMTLKRAKQQVATDVTQSYYQVILDRRILEIDLKNFEAMQSREKLISSELQVGSASPADAAQQSSQTALAESAVISTRQKIQDDQILLIQKLRLDPARSYDLKDLDPSMGTPETLEDVPAMTKKALDLRPDLQASESLTKRADEEVSVARADYFPKLNLGFSLQGNGSTLYHQFVNGADNTPGSQQSLFPQLGNQIYYTVALTLTWNILDRGLTRLNVAQARATSENSEIDYEDAKIAVIREINQVSGDYAASRAALLAAHRATLASQKAYDVIAGRYKVGASSLVDLITAQAALVQAQSSEAQARINLGFEAKLVDFYEGKTAVE